MKTLVLFIGTALLLSFKQTSSESKEIEKLDILLTNWHQAAAKADLSAYFDAMAENFIFLGTAPEERWDKKTFMEFCKPHFEKGKGWDFKKNERHITLSKDGKMAWFDEKIDTWMRDCRGSGVFIKEGKNWKLAQYNLAVLIENDKIKDFILLRDLVKE